MECRVSEKAYCRLDFINVPTTFEIRPNLNSRFATIYFQKFGHIFFGNYCVKLYNSKNLFY